MFVVLLADWSLRPETKWGVDKEQRLQGQETKMTGTRIKDDRSKDQRWQGQGKRRQGQGSKMTGTRNSYDRDKDQRWQGQGIAVIGTRIKDDKDKEQDDSDKDNNKRRMTKGVGCRSVCRSGGRDPWNVCPWEGEKGATTRLSLHLFLFKVLLVLEYVCVH